MRQIAIELAKRIKDAGVRSKLRLEMQLEEGVTVSEGPTKDRMMPLRVRAARYSRLLHFVAERVLGNPNKAAIAVDNCLYGAAQHVTASDCEGAFRSWLVRLLIEEALMILHGRTTSGTSRVWRATEGLADK